LVAEGHAVTILTCGFAGSQAREERDGITIIRIGNNRYAHSFQALMHYLRRMRNTYDAVIEVVNTAPYFGVFFGRRAKRLLFYHQLAEDIWFYETKMPLSLVGRYFLEPVANRLLAQANVPVLTVSDSTRRNLNNYGFRPEKTHVISEGLQMDPLPNLEAIAKYDRPTMLSLGAMRAMKRTRDQLSAFEIAKDSLPDLQLKIAGAADDPYGQAILKSIEASPYRDDIEYLGRVSADGRLALMQRCHVITATSVKEGWGLTVSEAASQGTPAVVYNVDGLRDSVRHGETGLVVTASPAALAAGIVQLLTDRAMYEQLQANGWGWSKNITFDQAYSDFKTVLEAA
jgi:glycosyltransferase involved in cell wall biosynthesis